MFINDVNKKEEIRNIATQHLRKYGIKHRLKKPRQNVQVAKYGKKMFKVPLQSLETETVTLKNGQQLVLPKRLHEMCSFILSKAQVEGIFRKEGSKSRQNEIKLSLDRGCLLGNEHHVIDVAVVLKSFLRELPEPLIPYSYHELFLRCSLIEKKLEAIYLACLLLPTEHLNVLSYLMQFFNEVATYADSNKMTYSNLAIVVGPNIFPIDEKVAPKSQLILTKTCDIIKLMIENSRNIGLIPDFIIEQVGSFTDVDLEEKRRKKRRSGSLTRMFNGLKKMVGSKPEDDNCTNIVTPDLLLTPAINRSIKKRKAESGLSAKKKKDLINKLPECALLNTPFTPARTPICVHPNGKKSVTVVDDTETQEIQKEKKLHWYMRSRSMKSLKDEEEPTTRRNSIGPKSLLERRWSAVSNATNFRKKKRNSCASSQTKKIESCGTISENKSEEPKPSEPDYVRVSKLEYEEIKSRVSAIEKRISIELETVQQCNHVTNDDENNQNSERDDNLQNVQTAYEQTMNAAPLSPTTDHLARRLSKELRIRRNSEQKIIRSPSARKIGSLRRRSREMERKSVKLTRNQSWHVGLTENMIIPRVSLRRKPNATDKAKDDNSKTKATKNSPEQTTINRSTSFQSTCKLSPVTKQSETSSSSQLSCNTSGSSSTHWVSADDFLSSTAETRQGKIQQDNYGSGRASIAKLRSQNAGMVLAKARLFDNLKDSDSSGSIRSESSQPNSLKKARSGNKIGSVRSSETRMSYRIRALRSEDRKTKKSMSPRRKHANYSQKQRMHMARQYLRSKENPTDSLTTPLRESNRMDVDTPKCTGRSVPHIKRAVLVKSPKRLCRTPVAYDRNTPLKVLSTPTCVL